jgi:DNA-binding transcriptional LysR family regulator
MQLDTVRAFLKVAELASFTRAAEQLGLSKARVSTLVQELEAELGSRLLSRSTRAVRLTASGEQLLVRAHKLIADADELRAMFHAPSSLQGTLRVDAPQGLACSVIIPNLPQFLAQHPRIEVRISSTDRRVDVVRDAFDCVVRVGKLPQSGLVARKLGTLTMVNCASLGYLKLHGTPHTLDDLSQHSVVHYSLQLGADAPDFEYRDGASYHTRPMRSRLTVNNTHAYLAACLAGFGIVQVPRYGVSERLQSGELVEVLPDHVCEPMPIALVHGYTRHVPRHVRAWLSWLSPLITKAVFAHGA